MVSRMVGLSFFLVLWVFGVSVDGGGGRVAVRGVWSGARAMSWQRGASMVRPATRAALRSARLVCDATAATQRFELSKYEAGSWGNAAMCLAAPLTVASGASDEPRSSAAVCMPSSLVYEVRALS